MVRQLRYFKEVVDHSRHDGAGFVLVKEGEGQLF